MILCGWEGKRNVSDATVPCRLLLLGAGEGIVEWQGVGLPSHIGRGFASKWETRNLNWWTVSWLVQTFAVCVYLLLSTHSDRQDVDISVTVCVFVCLYGYGFLRRGKLAASNFARRFIGVQGMEYPIVCELCSSRSPKLDESVSERATPTRM